MFEFTEKEEEFFAKRDKATESLIQCDSYVLPEYLEQKGYKLIQNEFLKEKRSEYSLYVYEKDGKKVVYNQVYEEREGGMYHQSLFTEDGKMP